MADLIGREHHTTEQLIYKLFWHATFDIPDEQTCPLLFHIKNSIQIGCYLQTHKTKLSLSTRTQAPGMFHILLDQTFG